MSSIMPFRGGWVGNFGLSAPDGIGRVGVGQRNLQGKNALGSNYF